jgi:hypothetical protein
MQDVIAFLTMLSNVVMAAATIALFWLGRKGLMQWREELKGRTQFELAQRLALLGHQFETDCGLFRGLSYGSTWVDSSQLAGEFEDEASIRHHYRVKSEALERLRLTSNKIQECAWEAENLLDDEVVWGCERLIVAYAELMATTRMYFTEKLETRKNPEWQKMPVSDSQKQAQEMLYGFYPDTYAGQLHRKIEKLWASLKPYIK